MLHNILNVFIYFRRRRCRRRVIFNIYKLS